MTEIGRRWHPQALAAPAQRFCVIDSGTAYSTGTGDPLNRPPTWLLAFALAFAAAACGSTSHPETSSASATPAAPAPPAASASGTGAAGASASTPQVDFEVQDVSVKGALELFTKRTGQAVQIGPLDLPNAMCKKVSLRLKAASASEILDAFDAALDGSPLRLERAQPGQGTHQLKSRGKPAWASCGIDPAIWAGWITPGIKLVEPQRFEITQASFALIATQFPNLRFSFQRPIDGGLVITDTHPQSLPAMLGILENDRLTSVQGIDAGRNGDLDKQIHKLAELKVGDTLEIALVRDKKPLKLTYRIVP